MTESKKEWFTITIKYFKPSGKYYSEGSFNLEVTDCGPPGHPTCYMNEVADHVRGLRDRGERMPGLSGSWSAGHILIDCEEGYPVLILGKF